MPGQTSEQAILRQLPGANQAEQRRLCYPLSLTEVVTLGRDLQCHIVLDTRQYATVSRRHAELCPGSVSPSGSPIWWVCDLGSANGTFVNGVRLLGPQELRSGDRIQLGEGGPEFMFEWQPLTQPIPLCLPPVQPAAAPMATTARTGAVSDPVTISQLFPILSTGRDLHRKAYLVPGIVTISFVVMLFASVGSPISFNLLLAAYLSIAAYYFVYQLCGKHKPWWVLMGVGAATILLLQSPLLPLFILIFRQILPGNVSPDNAISNFALVLVQMFFGAGLMEELLKALPVLGAWWLGTRLRPPWRERVGVWEPLDGILLGTASAVGFTLIETLGQYVPEAIQTATVHSGEGAGELAGLQLLIPRILGLVAGHMAYTGYLGYFIGLSVLKPAQRWLILAMGYLSASGLHALWNTSGAVSVVLLAMVGVMSYAFLGAAILKARALSPTRSQNFATRFFE